MGENPPFPKDRLLRPAEVCSILSISRSGFYRFLTLGQLPFLRIGKVIRILPGDLETFLARQPGENTRIHKLKGQQ